MTLAVTRDVLVPRPETELVVERALAHLAEGGARARARSRDRQRRDRARDRARASRVPGVRDGRVGRGDCACDRECPTARHCKHASSTRARGTSPRAKSCSTLITCNPPYVADDDAASRLAGAPSRAPSGALCGADRSRGAAHGDRRRAGPPAPGGWLVVEHGATQGEAVRALLAAAGFTEVSTFRDLAGHERCTEGTLPSRTPGT